MINMSGNPEGDNLPELKNYSFVVILVLVCLPSIPPSHSISTGGKNWSSRVVTTTKGLARGFLFMPKGYEGVEVFLAIPYASPPVGSLRLMPPVSASPWSGTKMNEEHAPVCPQVFPFPVSERTTDGESVDDESESGSSNSNGGSGDDRESIIDNRVGVINETELLKKMPRGKLAQLKRLAPFLRNQSEDCLYLNIYVPLSASEGRTDRLLPVLVFIQGDDNSYGSGNSYDFSMLVSQGNVIVITFNFRLGILGFLNANSEGYFKSPANFALLDQIAALHWVQENIGAFGGDNLNVTLMGHRKGAMYVNFLMISNALPSSEPLFHRVILMSGSALSPFTVGLSYGKDLAKKFAARFNCPIDSGPSKLLQCVRLLPLQYFLESELWKFFGPSDDGVVIENGIRENILRDKLSRYPMIFGVTKAEFLPTLSEHDAVHGLDETKRREVLKQFIDGFYSSYRSEILAAAIHEYTDWERPVQHPISVRDETLEALTDAQIVAPMVKVGELSSQVNSQTYFYVFEYQSKSSDYIQKLGCVPFEELWFVLGFPLLADPSELESSSRGDGTDSLKSGYFRNFNFTRGEMQLSLQIMHYWANFIKTGNPNVEVVSSDSQAEESSQGGFSSSADSATQNRFPHQDKSSSSSSQSLLKPKLIEWPSYDALLKKYLLINSEAKPRVRSFYRSHKLSFWLVLVPELMRGYGNGGGGIPPKGIGYPNIINSSNPNMQPHPPTIQLYSGAGPPYWDPFHFSGNFSSYPGGDVSGPLGSRPNQRLHHNYGQDGGYPIYSTALSITIAVGSSLLILNILVFAAFYYFRDKRANRQASANQNLDSHHHHHTPGPISASGADMDHAFPTAMDLQLQATMVDNKRQLSCNSAETMVHPSIHNTPMRLKENGQVLNVLQQHQYQHHQIPQQQQQQQAQQLPMPNVCVDLPMSNLQQMNPPDSSRNPQQQQHHYQQQQQLPNTNSPFSGVAQSSTLPSNKRQQQQRNSLQNFELSMPDAILAAAMMLNYRQNNSSQAQGSSDFFFGKGHKSSSTGKRLNMKEHLLQYEGPATNSTSNTSSGFNIVSGGGGPSSNMPGVVVGNFPGKSSVPETGYPPPVSVNMTSAGSVSGGGSNSNVSSNVIQFDFENRSKTVPRKHTPTVKFSPDTFTTDGSICSGSTSLNANVSLSGDNIVTSSISQPGILKKQTSYPSSGLSERLDV